MTFEVEIKSLTYRVYKVSAQDAEAAEQAAYRELDTDCSVSRAWAENAVIESIAIVDEE